MSRANHLSLEQEFSLQKIASQVKTLSPGQAQELIVELQRQLMIKDNLCKQIIRQEWRI